MKIDASDVESCKGIEKRENGAVWSLSIAQHLVSRDYSWIISENFERFRLPKLLRGASRAILFYTVVLISRERITRLIQQTIHVDRDRLRWSPDKWESRIDPAWKRDFLQVCRWKWRTFHFALRIEFTRADTAIRISIFYALQKTRSTAEWLRTEWNFTLITNLYQRIIWNK